MHTLANQHYLSEKDEHKDAPAHWSGPAERYQESLVRLNGDMAKAINRAPAPFREIMAAMHAEILQIRRMVSEGVIIGMVRKEFWGERCYGSVPVQVNDFVCITEATIQLFEELFARGDLKADPEIRAKINEAVARTRLARKALAA